MDNSLFDWEEIREKKKAQDAINERKRKREIAVLIIICAAVFLLLSYCDFKEQEQANFIETVACYLCQTEYPTSMEEVLLYDFAEANAYDIPICFACIDKHDNAGSTFLINNMEFYVKKEVAHD